MKVIGEAIESLVQSVKYRLRICQHDGCWSRHTTACHLPDENMQPGDGNPDYYYCYKHAQGKGFCHCCGDFWGGIESFDFGSGLCEHCEDQFAWDDYDDDYDNYERL